jgi:cell division septation protein DedD
MGTASAPGKIAPESQQGNANPGAGETEGMGMKRMGRILLAGGILAAVLLAGIAAAQGGGLTFSKNGDTVTISGATNLAVGDRLLVSVVSAAFTPTGKGTGGGFSGAAGTVTVQPGSPLNTYRFDVNVSTFQPGEYLVSVESLETSFTTSGQFVLPWTPAPILVPTSPATTPATTTTTPSATPTIPPATQPTATPLPVILSLCALVSAACILLHRR